MNGMRWIRQGVVGVLVTGMTLWNAAIPAALAQIEPHVIDQCRDVIANDPAIDPAVRDICLTEVLPRVEEASAEGDTASPEARAELQVVETTAVAIHEATVTAQEALADPDAVATETVAVLAANGVPPDVAAGVETQLKDALAKASETLRAGGTLEDASKYLEICQRAMADCSGYLGGKDFKEIFAAGGAGFDRPELGTFCGVAFDPSQRDGFQAVMEAHFSASVQEMMTQGGGMEANAMRGMMEQMAASGINPAEMMAHSGAEFHGPSPEAMAAMTPEQRAGYEAWKSGDVAKMQEMVMHDSKAAMEKYGMSPETIAKEMATMEAHMKEMATMDPRTDSSGATETTFATHGVTGSVAPAPSPGTTEVLIASHDHDLNGMFDEHHYDTNGDGIADHAHSVPH